MFTALDSRLYFNYAYFNSLSGLPHRPRFFDSSSSSDGMIFVTVATDESGVELQPLRFVVQARLRGSVAVEEFEMVVFGYRDGEPVHFTLDGFTQEGEEPQVYDLTAVCSNEFGKSEESHVISVTLQFSTGMHD